MSFTSLVMLLVLFLVFIFIAVGVTFHRKQRTTQNKPPLLAISSLFLQLVLFVLFFTEILVSFNEVFVDILWWGTVIYGLAIGIKEIKNNVIVSMLTIFLSILLAILNLLLLFITSM
ncbi:hypothetical protein [Pontibacillus salipaludis]|uniref:Uncharacterized protein n=1 Tax=Pontibacillus salipaludis TaxID=1697394 RepID=A0ABQ1Q5W1_9BACI|nr:hypothetical protein [Pontibacillus salipaludis]GGD13462.1 hypothetical protein GCM10011389_21360 [Pontibacillus salipaludis]